MADEKARVDMQTQSNIQSAQAANQAKMQTIQAEGQQKIGLSQAEHQQKMELMNEEAKLKSQLMEKEFNYNMQLKGMQDTVVDQRDAKKEDAKDNRTKMQATQQSKLIEQRKRDLPAQNFESNYDSASDGFDFAQFSPK